MPCTTQTMYHTTCKKINGNIASALLSAGYVEAAITLPTLPHFERIRHTSVLYFTATKDGQQRAICILKYQTELQFGSIA